MPIIPKFTQQTRSGTPSYANLYNYSGNSLDKIGSALKQLGTAVDYAEQGAAKAEAADWIANYSKDSNLFISQADDNAYDGTIYQDKLDANFSSKYVDTSNMDNMDFQTATDTLSMRYLEKAKESLSPDAYKMFKDSIQMDAAKNSVKANVILRRQKEKIAADNIAKAYNTTVSSSVGSKQPIADAINNGEFNLQRIYLGDLNNNFRNEAQVQRDYDNALANLSYSAIQNAIGNGQAYDALSQLGVTKQVLKNNPEVMREAGFKWVKMANGTEVVSDGTTIIDIPDKTISKGKLQGIKYLDTARQTSLKLAALRGAQVTAKRDHAIIEGRFNDLINKMVTSNLEAKDREEIGAIGKAITSDPNYSKAQVVDKAAKLAYGLVYNAHMSNIHNVPTNELSLQTKKLLDSVDKIPLDAKTFGSVAKDPEVADLLKSGAFKKRLKDFYASKLAVEIEKHKKMRKEASADYYLQYNGNTYIKESEEISKAVELRDKALRRAGDKGKVSFNKAVNEAVNKRRASMDNYFDKIGIPYEYREYVPKALVQQTAQRMKDASSTGDLATIIKAKQEIDTVTGRHLGPSAFHMYNSYLRQAKDMLPPEVLSSMEMFPNARSSELIKNYADIAYFKKNKGIRTKIMNKLKESDVMHGIDKALRHTLGANNKSKAVFTRFIDALTLGSLEFIEDSVEPDIDEVAEKTLDKYAKDFTTIRSTKSNKPLLFTPRAQDAYRESPEAVQQRLQYFEKKLQKADAVLTPEIRELYAQVYEDTTWDSLDKATQKKYTDRHKKYGELIMLYDGEVMLIDPLLNIPIPINAWGKTSYKFEPSTVQSYTMDYLTELPKIKNREEAKRLNEYMKSVRGHSGRFY